jgi:hypothetical protein
MQKQVENTNIKRLKNAATEFDNQPKDFSSTMGS